MKFILTDIRIYLGTFDHDCPQNKLPNKLQHIFFIKLHKKREKKKKTWIAIKLSNELQIQIIIYIVQIHSKIYIQLAGKTYVANHKYASLWLILQLLALNSWLSTNLKLFNYLLRIPSWGCWSYTSTFSSYWKGSWSWAGDNRWIIFYSLAHSEIWAPFIY